MKEKIDYTALDAAILSAIRTSDWHPQYLPGVREIADRIAEATGRKTFRIVDARLQAMRKAGTVVHDRRSGGWVEVKA